MPIRLYLRRLNALYYEFTETGMADRCGYTSPADMVDKYPGFFWRAVEPYIGDALRYLGLTIEGNSGSPISIATSSRLSTNGVGLGHSPLGRTPLRVSLRLSRL